jgi:F0F1-type ATP synthase membrane subunit c/vacuolar-type H+-ATPase subunit K
MEWYRKDFEEGRLIERRMEWADIILLGFRYLASSIPLISLAGVAIGVGLIFSILIFAICRNPVISNVLIRWAFIGFSLVEVSGSIGSVYSLLIPYAFLYNVIA